MRSSLRGEGAGRRSGWALAALLALLAPACNRTESPTISTTGAPSPAPEPSVSISSPADGTQVDGNVVTLAVAAEGMEIKAPDGDRSGRTGHFHVYVDKEPAARGQVIPMEEGIVHSAPNPIVLTGLAMGEHRLTVVLGNGVHERVGDTSASVKVNVRGPSVTASAPASVKAGEPVVVAMAARGVTIREADGDKSGKTAHYHLYVDPEKEPAADGQVIPKIEGKIIHTTESRHAIEGLAPGQHTIWVVMGDGLHMPLDPLVASKLMVTVTG